MLPEEENNHQYHLATNPATTAGTHLKDTLVQQWNKCSGLINKPPLDCISSSVHEMETIPDTASVAKNLRLDAYGKT